MSPYRQIARPLTPAWRVDPGVSDAELLPVFAVLWLASVARVALGFAHHEVFGTEGTLALLAVVALPVPLARASWCWLRRARYDEAALSSGVSVQRSPEISERS